MNKKELYNIKKFIDDILLRSNLTFIELSNSLLHIHRYQSDFLLRYTDPVSLKISVSRKVKKVHSRLILSPLGRFFRGKKLVPSSSVCDFLIVSHYVAKSNDKTAYEDFYFSQIIDTLQNLGYGVRVLYINGADDSILKSCNQKNDRVVYETLTEELPIYIAFLFLSGVVFQSLLYRIFALFTFYPEKKKFYRIVSRMESSWSNLSTAYNIGRMVGKYRCRFLITTYEGQAYERLTYFFSREFHKRVICIGYFHAAIFEYQFAVRQSLGRNYDPDLILTQGDFASRVLSESYISNGDIVHTIGSPRTLCFNHLVGKEDAILVIPSGIFSEVIFLLDFAKKTSEMLPSYKFYFRLHPSFDLALLESNLLLEGLPLNFFVSTSSLEFDANRCRFTFFRDSTAIFNSIALGSLPIYISKTDDELQVNPVYAMNQVLPFISTPFEFKEKLELLCSMDPSIFQNGIRDIVSDYNENKLIEVIKGIS